MTKIARNHMKKMAKIIKLKQNMSKKYRLTWVTFLRLHSHQAPTKKSAAQNKYRKKGKSH